jgi:transaldolase
MTSLATLKIKIFADGADLAGMVRLSANPAIRGFTTNPTLIRKAGIADFESFGREVLKAIPDKPISFEVFADDFAEMEAQAHAIQAWGENVYVKIPVTDTRGQSACPLIGRLGRAGIRLNVTAVMLPSQVRAIAEALDPAVPAIVSVFAGRVADTGVDPVPLMQESLAALSARPRAELLWASPREVLNIFHADAAGVHIITVTPDLLAKLALLGKDLAEYSRETVTMFHDDARAAGFTIRTQTPVGA